MARKISKTRTLIEFNNLINKLVKLEKFELAESLKQIKDKFEEG